MYIKNIILSQSQIKSFVSNDLYSLWSMLSLHSNIRIVGGAIRDYIISAIDKSGCLEFIKDIGENFQQKTDYDFVIQVKNINSFLEVLKKNDIKYQDRWIKYGAIKVYYKNHKYDLNLLRKDINCYGRQADTDFVSDISWKDDAMRRDFTINAISIDISGNIYDYFNGIEDLRFKRVKFIGDAYQRINEDYLRILRYFRFLSLIQDKNAEIPMNIDTQACIDLSINIHKLSKERIRLEVLKILITKNMKIILEFMCSNKILQEISKTLNKYINFSFKSVSNTDPILNIAIIIIQNNINEIISQNDFLNLKKELALENDELAIIVKLQEMYQFEYTFSIKNELDYNLNINKKIQHQEIAFRFGYKFYSLFIDFVSFKFGLEIKKIEFEDVPKFLLNGNDFKGKIDQNNIGKLLKKSQDYFIESGFRLSKNELLEKAYSILN